MTWCEVLQPISSVTNMDSKILTHVTVDHLVESSAQIV